MNNEAPHTVPAEPPTSSRAPFACDFRVIGYDLETKNVEDFELEREGADYVVLGRTKMAQPSQNGFVRAFRTLCEILQKPAAVEPLKWVYTPDAISALREEAQEKRRQAEGMEATHSMSQVLRAVGAYLDLKEASLLRVSKQGPWVTLEYEVEPGERMVEEFTVSTLYDFCVRMYLKRRGRRQRN